MPADDQDATMRAVPRRPVLEPAGYRVVVADGADVGAEVIVEAAAPNRVLVGTSPACDLVLHDALVSRRHLALEATARGLRVTDLGSTNGTFVGSARLAEVWLAGPDTLVVGATRLAIARRDEAPARIVEAGGFGAVLGASPAMRRLYPLCERLARADVPVVIEGETGTGKEHLAEAIHAQSARARGAYVVFDCTAVAPSLIESELFGHERGAFTGATTSRRGVFERASGGTLLIDEIGDLPLELQARLLRAIERRQIQRVGGDAPIAVDVRILAATRRDLDQEVQRGRFRDDLFHRLAVARIELPPLREREGDVRLLAQRFATDIGGPEGAVPEDVLARWERERWPGNVRELRNAVARWLALGDLAPPAEARSDRPPPRPVAADPFGLVLAQELPWSDARDRVLDAFEGRYVRNALARHDGNVTRAAAASGLARRYFHRLKARHEGGSPDDEDDG